MRAVVMHERGDASVLVVETVPTPVPAAGEVLVRVRAATVNHTDLFHRSGRFFIQKPLPHILGMDVAGEIAVLGDDVEGWAVGDRVVATFEALGRERDGAYAEYTTVPAAQLHGIPDGLDFTSAASIGLAFTTAWTALFTTGELGEGRAAGERVAIHAAASGVGSAAVQIAAWARATVVAICDAGKAERVAAWAPTQWSIGAPTTSPRASSLRQAASARAWSSTWWGGPACSRRSTCSRRTAASSSRGRFRATSPRSTRWH